MLLRCRIALLVIAVIVAGVAFGPARSVQFDRSIEKMFSPDDPLLPPYRKLKHTFGGNEVVLGVYSDPWLMNPDKSGIQRVAKLGRDLKKIKGVKGVLSLDRPIGEAIIEDTELARRTRKLFENYTHSQDLQTVALVCMLHERTPSMPRGSTIRSLRGALRSVSDGNGVIAGAPVMIHDGFQYIEEDGRRLGLWSSILLGGVIIVSFRSLRWVLIPLAVVQFTVMLTRATLVWSGLRMTLVSSMLTAIVTVVGVATVMHIVVRFRDLRAAGMSRQEAFEQALRLLIVPVSLACLTDAVGFASLLVAGVGPVRDFGLMMAIGSLLVLVAVAMLVPALALIGRRATDPQKAWGEHRLDRWLAVPLLWSVHHRRWIAVAIAVLIIAAVAGLPRLQVETDFTKNFRSTSPIVRAYTFIESELGGAGVLDVVLPAPETLEWDYLSRVLRLEERLRQEVVVTSAEGTREPGVTKVLSLADAVVAGSPVDLNKVGINVVRNGMVAAGLKAMQLKLPVFYEALYGEDAADGHRYFRVMLRAKEKQPAEQKLLLVEQIDRICREEFPETDGQPVGEATGFFVLLTNLVRSMIRDQWVTFGVATAGIGAMMLLAFRSVKLALVALVPNMLPIVLLLGVMGWMGMSLNMGAAMIAAVSMGLSIDGSIHYLTFFRRARAATGRTAAAIAEVQHSVGRALIFATLALIVGFSVLCTSDFVPTIYFGALVSLSMLGGLIGNLVLLPLMLGAVYPDASQITGESD